MQPQTIKRRVRNAKPQPLSSFDPRLGDLLLKGAISVVEIPCADRSEATRLRQRLNQYRFAARAHFGDAERGEWEPLYRCIVQTRDSLVILRPRDSEFEAALDAARITKISPTAEEVPTTFLDDLAKEQEK